MPRLEPSAAKQEPRDWNRLPPHTVFAIFEDEVRARIAEERLLCTGIPHSRLQVLSGPEGANLLLPDTANADPDVLSQALGAITDQTKFLEAYAERLRAGQALIAAKFDEPEERGHIEALLLDSGGRGLTYTSGWTITVVGNDWKD